VHRLWQEVDQAQQHLLIRVCSEGGLMRDIDSIPNPSEREPEEETDLQLNLRMNDLERQRSQRIGGNAMAGLPRVLDRDPYGRETLWQCSDCGQPFNLGWGSRCNKCIRDEKRHQELLTAIREAKNG
jgi:hypothetical protein